MSGLGPRARERGIALVGVLWMLALLGVIATGFAATTRTEGLIAHNHVEAARARAVAEEVLHWAVFEWLASPIEERRRADGRRYDLQVGEDEVRAMLSVEDEGAKVDLNAAPAALLEGLLRVLGVEEPERLALVDAIQDWRDPDDLRRPFGAEAAEYRAAGFGYGPRNDHFESIDELRLVFGMTPELYERMRPLVTVHSRRAQVNVDTASVEVLRAIPGLSEEQALEWVQTRAAAEAPLGTREARRVAGAYAARGTGGVYTFSVQAVLPSGAAQGLRATLRLDGLDGYTVLDWESGVPPAAEHGTPEQAAWSPS
jgi:general secretion pathway protein K